MLELAKTRLQKPLVLCVEDDPIYITLRKKVLEQEGYGVIGASKPGEALTILRELPVCAVIADHMLQRTTGTELDRQMKTIKPDVPIILFSGNPPRGLNGVDVYVNKGESTDKFLGIVSDVVERFRL